MKKMKNYILLLLSIIFLASCGSTKVELKKYNLADTNITFGEYDFSNFISAFQTLYPEEAYTLATTESQKLAAKGLNYVTQNRLDDAADTFCKALMEKDTFEVLWKYFPKHYYSFINYNWDKLEEYVNIRDDIRDNHNDSMFVFGSCLEHWFISDIF